MQIKASCGSDWNFSLVKQTNFTLELQITGIGTIDNPYLITSGNYWSNKSFELNISKSNSYIKIKNVSLKALYLKQCENITISNVNLKYLGLGNCSTISIENVKITKQLRLSKVTQIKIVECNIGKLFAFSGDHISIFNSDIKKISKESKATFYIQAEDKKALLNRSSENVRKYITPDFWLCSHCGSEVDMYSIFCPDCGFRLEKYVKNNILGVKREN